MFTSVTACFTGHRPNKLGGYNPNPIQTQIRKRLTEMIRDTYGMGIRNFITGMALGVDQWACEILIDLRKRPEYKDIKIIAAIPFKGQEGAWFKQSVEHYNELLKQVDRVEYTSPPGYAAWKMQTRNKWMVDHSKIVIAVWDGTSSGTANCVKYAQIKKKQIYRINP